MINDKSKQSEFCRKTEVKMKSGTMLGLIFSVFVAVAGLFLASGAMALTTEHDCINGGGYISEGSGCRFCIGGKFDLSEINAPVKEKTSYGKSEQKTVSKDLSQSDTTGRLRRADNN
jgi:hypothetical protein